MKKITKYVADDGLEFPSEREAQDYESVMNEITSSMKRLKPTPDTASFANRGDYIQQDPALALTTSSLVLTLMNEYLMKNGRTIEIGLNSINDDIPETFSRILHILNCMDNRGRHYGQSYWTTHESLGGSLVG